MSAITFVAHEPGVPEAPTSCLLQKALQQAGVKMYGGDVAAGALGLPPAPSSRHEYGEPALTIELVDSMDEAIDHIHKHGSSHTECILTSESPCQSLGTPPPPSFPTWLWSQQMHACK